MGGEDGGPEERNMRSTKERSSQMFAAVPRPWGLAGVVTVVVWVFLAVAFVSDAVPSSSSEEWLYNVEARRAAWAERLTARETRATAQVAARRAPAALRAQAPSAATAGRVCN
jgi:hypothetical protein